MSRLDVAEVLAECLDDIKAGRRSPAECLAAYPELGSSLEPLLTMALRIEPLKPRPLDGRHKEVARQRFVEALHREHERPTSRLLALAGLGLRPARGMSSILAVVLAVAVGSAAVLASQRALPGDTLYSVKTAVEWVQVASAPTDVDKAAIELWIAERRLAEVQWAIDNGNGSAAGLAAEDHAGAMLGACDQLDRAMSEGKDIGGFLARLNAIQQRQDEALRLARATGDARTRQALERARAEVLEESQEIQASRAND